MENPSAVNTPGNAFAICLLSPHSRKSGSTESDSCSFKKLVPDRVRRSPCNRLGNRLAAEVESFISNLQLFKDGANIPLDM